jgi:hypothetical protein
MTTKQESRLGMYLASRDYLAPNTAFTKDLPEFTSIFTALQNSIIEIQNMAELQRFDKRGLAKEKKQFRDSLILLTSDNSSKLSAYARLSNNVVLLSEVRFTKSLLQAAPDTGLKDMAQCVYDKAQANLSSLGTYGITVETQSVLLGAIISYNSSLAKPRLGMTEKSQATRQIAILFTESDKLIVKLDAVIGILMMGQPNFYNGYKSVRKVINTGNGSLALKGAAVELPRGIPLKGVTFTFAPDSSLMTGSGANGEIVKKTAEKGSFNIKSMPEGIYRVRVTKTGYKEKVIIISISPGEMTTLNVELERA